MYAMEGMIPLVLGKDKWVFYVSLRTHPHLYLVVFIPCVKEIFFFSIFAQDRMENSNMGAVHLVMFASLIEQIGCW